MTQKTASQEIVVYPQDRLALNFFMSHFVSGLLAALIFWGILFIRWSPVIGLSVAAVISGLTGLFWTAGLRNLIQRIEWVVNQLYGEISPAILQFSLGSPLAGLAAALNRLIKKRKIIEDAQEIWLLQVRQAAAQEERNRLARDLHDSIKQQIYAIQLSAASAEMNLKQESPEFSNFLTQIRSSANEAMVEMNALLAQLRPDPLERTGLVEALREQCEALQYRSEIEVSCAFAHLPALESLAPGLSKGIFRLAQEALSNIARHARAHRARLTLDVDAQGKNLLLEIEDDGCGFDPLVEQNGMGLKNMRQRAQEAGGIFTIHSEPGQGTSINFSFPLVKPQQTADFQFSTLLAQGRRWIRISTLAGILFCLGAGLYPRLGGAQSDFLGTTFIFCFCAFIMTGIGIWKARRPFLLIQMEGQQDHKDYIVLRRDATNAALALAVFAFWWNPWYWRMLVDGWDLRRYLLLGILVLTAIIAVGLLIRVQSLNVQYQKMLPPVERQNDILQLLEQNLPFLLASGILIWVLLKSPDIGVLGLLFSEICYLVYLAWLRYRAERI